MTEEINRAPQELDSRENTKRPNDSWIPASSLPSPNPRDGISHRWIRTSVLGQVDNTNVSQKMREGWVAVKATDYPEIDYVPDKTSRYPENIEYGGLLLCSIPSEMLDKRTKYYSEMAVKIRWKQWTIVFLATKTLEWLSSKRTLRGQLMVEDNLVSRVVFITRTLLCLQQRPLWEQNQLADYPRVVLSLERFVI